MDIQEQIKNALEDIRPSLQADGGDVQFVNWNEDKGVVKVEMMGMCAGCPMAQVTLKEGLEKHLKKQVPEVRSVESV